MLLQKRQYRRNFFLFSVLLLLPFFLSAHVVKDQLAGLSRSEIGWTYLRLGFTHILPLGLDHILFVLSIFFLNPKLKSVLLQATAFTVAHSITLGLAMYGLITPPTYIIEPIIALSILFVAVENMITEKLRPSRILIVFGFGLVHGMGFASALTELGLLRNEFATSIIMFNIGVELGQVAVILAAWYLVGKWFSKKEWYHKRIVIPVSAVIAVIALFWTIQRTFFP